MFQPFEDDGRDTSKSLVDASHSMDDLPIGTASFERGDLSLDQFVEFARLATRQNEAKLLSWAKRTTPSGIRARADAERRIASEDTREADRWRSLTWSWEDDNTRLWFSGSLAADQGARFIQAVDRLAKRMPVTPEVEGDQDWGTTIDARRADALAAMASSAIANDPDADRATVVVHVDLDSARGESNGMVHGGQPLAPDLTAMLMCDSRLQPVLHDSNGT